MQYDQDHFIWDVINEAIALRTHATQLERDRLSINRLHPMSRWECIYGLITGDCFSQRAAELIALCCTRYFHHGAVTYMTTMERISEYVDGTFVKDFIKARTDHIMHGLRYFSAIEAYITLNESKKENLIAYLRGETEELDIYL